MGKIVKFNPKQERNLYMVDNYHVILASTAEDALAFAQEKDDTDDIMEVKLLDDEFEIPFIKSGKVEIALWLREPQPLERLSFKMTVRNFIDESLKRFPLPSAIDIVEDRGAIKPKG